MIIYKKSKARHNNTNYYISLIDGKKYLCISGSHDGFEGRYLDEVFIAPLNANNATEVRKRFPWLLPKPLSVNTSFGFGDRLGYATTGHIGAIEGTNIYPIFAQQSVRENERTKRSPQDVMDDAMWQVFECGYKSVWGADADHIKEIKDIDPFIEAGFTFYTIDPSDYVDNNVLNYSIDELKEKANNPEILKEYMNLTNTLGLEINETLILQAIVKYIDAINHVKKISDYLSQKLSNYDLEMSVDETDIETSPFEHFFIAKELKKREIPFTSLAPKFVGSFEKGVDYIGDIKNFEEQLKIHGRIMNYIGGYKLSIHTGSDKFSIYKELSLRTNNKIHVKTAGTSYLEALKVIATVDQEFFCEIYNFCKSRYEEDKKTYHVSAKLTNLENIECNESVFDNFDARQVMHVTFGSVLDKYKEKFDSILIDNLDIYNKYLKTHFTRHLQPFMEK